MKTVCLAVARKIWSLKNFMHWMKVFSIVEQLVPPQCFRVACKGIWFKSKIFSICARLKVGILPCVILNCLFFYCIHVCVFTVCRKVNVKGIKRGRPRKNKENVDTPERQRDKKKRNLGRHSILVSCTVSTAYCSLFDPQSFKINYFFAKCSVGSFLFSALVLMTGVS